MFFCEGCMYTAYMAANCGINLNDIPWQWLMAPFPTSSRHVVEDEVWISSIQNQTSNTENIFPFLCRTAMFLGPSWVRPPKTAWIKPNPSTGIHLLKLQSAQGRGIQQTKEIEGLTPWAPRAGESSRILWLMRDSRSYNGNKKRLYKSPQVEETYHMTKLMNLTR